MNPATIKSWLQQSTTGAGFAAILGTLSAVAAGSMSWHAALPVLVGAVAALVWPENKAAQKDASTLAQDILPFIPMVAAAVAHGQANPPPKPVETPK